MSTPEVAAKDRIKARVEQVLDEMQFTAKITWNAGASHGVPRLDCDGVIAGHPFAMEVKRFDNKGKLTGRQILDLKEYAAAGAFAIVVDSEESLENFLSWIRLLEPREPHPMFHFLATPL